MDKINIKSWNLGQKDFERPVPVFTLPFNAFFVGKGSQQTPEHIGVLLYWFYPGHPKNKVKMAWWVWGSECLKT